MHNLLKKMETNKYITILFLFLFSSVYYMSHFRWLSLLFDKGNYGGDGDIFLCLGLFLKKGMIPYKDFFDHKGPITVLVNYLIEIFTNPKIGAMIVTIIIVTVSLGGVYKILGLFYQHKIRVILTALSLIIFRLYGVGGLTESYCLPFLMWSMYFAVKFIQNSEGGVKHNKWYSFFYGITFAVCLLTRITNALVLCCAIFIGFIILIKNKQWGNIIINIIFFLMGMVCICIPFLVYFTYHDALYDMIYGTLIYNIMYASKTVCHFSLYDYIINIVYYFHLFFVAVIVGILHVKCFKKDKWISYLIIFTSICCIVYQLSGLMYTHYMIAYIPILFVAIGQIKEILQEEKLKRITMIILSVCIVLVAYKYVRIYQNCYNTQTSSSAALYEKEANEILEQIPKQNRNATIAYNVNAYFYLVTEIKPCYKYFILQDWQSSASSDMQNELKDFFASRKAEYIVLSTNGENVFDDVIFQNYEEVYKTQNLRLLKKK